MTRKIEHFRRGQKISRLRQPLNRVVDTANRLVVAVKGSESLAGFIPERTHILEIKSLGTLTLTCVAPGEAADPDAFEYEVVLPQIFTEASRDGVTYAYTDINTRIADGTENQELTPKFIVGEMITVTYIDLGAAGGAWYFVGDGRMWAKALAP